MLTIRPKQLAELRASMSEALEGRLAAHLNRYFPDRCRELGADVLRREIRHGINQAERYGIRTGQGICKYLNLMFLFGRDFDTDPRFPWASRILNGPGEIDAVPKIDRLYAAAAENDSTGVEAEERR